MGLQTRNVRRDGAAGAVRSERTADKWKVGAEVVENHPYANQVSERVRHTKVTKVGRTLVTTSSGTVFDTTDEPPHSKNSPSHHYLYTPEEFATETFKNATEAHLSKCFGVGGHGIGLDETLYIALALHLEIPPHLQERAHAIHHKIAASLLAPAEPSSSSGEPERPMPSTGATVRSKVRAK